VDWQIHHFDIVSSTNDVIADLAEKDAPNLTVAVAEHQTRGRGRSGAAWAAPRGTALLFSVLFRLPAQGSAPGCAPVRVGLAVAESIAEDAMLKWPNDVVLKGYGKVAGILCEGSFGQQRGYIVAGIGVNVTQTQDMFEDELSTRACSILSATGRRLERADLLNTIMSKLSPVAGRITEPLTDDELASIGERDILKGCDVICERIGSEAVVGRARGLAPDGALLIEQHGSVRRVYNGTVRFGSGTYPGSAAEH
jgi:BirA family transcriptional regulator, biotin operon repressor / biotin---[acetyl-CoA-carboxylase] ligase